jgi:hypothetical protein
MQILMIIGAIYLGLGFLYALYILLFAGDRWYLFPINMLGGPITVVYIVVITLKGKRMPIIR